MTAAARDRALIDELTALPAETSWAEFKENNAAPNRIGRLISAIANAARLADRDFGYVVWGVRDGDRAVLGTAFDPDARKVRGQPLEFYLSQRLSPDIAFAFRPVEHPGGRLVLLEIPAATDAPVAYERTAYIRIGSATPRLADRIERQKTLWAKLGAHAWETGVARRFVEPETVLDLLDWRSYFDLMRHPPPERYDAILERLEGDRLIARDAGGKWNILNLGAILFAGNLDRFGTALGRKAVRFVRYDGDGRSAPVTHRKDFPRGYASGFAKLNDYIETLVPAPEDSRAAIRSARPLFPPVAIRELIANALIHQDMTVSGAGPNVELFRNRLEIGNPGAPLVEPNRFIDSAPRSRNEALAALMRRMGLCEEQGTGIDKVVDAVESEHLPPPDFRAEKNATRVTLYGFRRFADMTAAERVRACYQHATLRHLNGNGQWMRNASLRKRFGVSARNAAQISQVIRRALDAGLIRVADPERPRAGYLPFWA